MTIREICERCAKQVVLHSRVGNYFRCPHCGFKNPGPALKNQDRTPPEGTRRRVARREKAAAGAEEPTPAATGAAPAPERSSGHARPVRRRKAPTAKSAPGTPGASGTPSSSPEPGAPPASAAATGSKRPWYDRMLGYTEEDR